MPENGKTPENFKRLANKKYMKRNITTEEANEIQIWLESELEKDIECAGYADAVSGRHFKILYRPKIKKFVVLDKTGGREWQYNDIHEATEKFNSL